MGGRCSAWRRSTWRRKSVLADGVSRHRTNIGGAIAGSSKTTGRISYRTSTPSVSAARRKSSSAVANAMPKRVARSRYAASYAVKPCFLHTDCVLLKTFSLVTWKSSSIGRRFRSSMNALVSSGVSRFRFSPTRRAFKISCGQNEGTIAVSPPAIRSEIFWAFYDFSSGKHQVSTIDASRTKLTACFRATIP